jgi:hypothetical protein
VLALNDGVAVQKLPYAKLRVQLLKDGQILEYSGPKTTRGVDPKSLKGVVLDDTDAKLTGEWKESGAAKSFIGDGYSHDANARDGKASARFEAKLPKAGKYRVMLASTPNNNRASNAPVEIHHAGGVQRLKLDLRTPKPADGVFWLDLGEHDFQGEASVIITNEGTDGYVVIDGIRWLPAGP